MAHPLFPNLPTPVVVLCVDDSPTLRRIVSNALHRNPKGVPFAVLEAADGFEALARVRENDVHLAIVDLTMPKMDGLELVRALRADPRGKSIAVVMVTVHSHEEDVVAAARAGVDDYIVKPFDEDQLVARVMRALERRPPVTPAT